MQHGRFVITAVAASLAGLLVGEQAARAERPDRTAIDAHLIRTEAITAKNINIPEGGTLFFEFKETVPLARLLKTVGDYEGLITNISSPSGIIVHPRLDEIRLDPAGDKVNVVLRWAVHAEPGARGSGPVRLSLSLLERTGLANTKIQGKASIKLKVVPAKTTRAQLALDFWGYRLYRRLAEEKLAVLKKRGLTSLALVDNGKMPSLDRVSSDTAVTVYEFERMRRRMWIAHRNLFTARSSKDATVAADAKAYIARLERPDSDLADLPVLNEAPPPPPTKGEGVTTLKPERVEPVPGAGGGGASGALAPVSTYEPGTDGDDILDETLPDDRPPTPPKAEEPKTPVAPAPGPQGATEPENSEAVAEAVADARTEDDFLGSGIRRLPEQTIPSYPRGLVLDDPNIAHAVGVRVSYASVDLRGTSGTVPAFFYYGQTSITRFLGVELTVPTALVDLDVARAKTRYLMGNPLVALKYRLHLPEVLGRKPAVTVRTRWAIPISPLNTIPPTSLGAEEFSFPAHFVDTYAFLLEKTDLGLGVSGTWMSSLIHLGFQLYGDYVFPVADSTDRTSFPVLGWGASVGVLPFGDLVAFYAEARAASLLSGPRRTELFTYLGARGHFERFELAGWLSLPVGSIGGLQLGADLRFSYDILDVVSRGKNKGSRAPDRSFME